MLFRVTSVAYGWYCPCTQVPMQSSHYLQGVGAECTMAELNTIEKSVFQSKHLEESCFGRTGQIIRQRPRHSGQRPRQFNFPMHMLKVITRNLRKNVPEFSEFMDEDTNQMHKSTQANRVIARLMIKHDLSQLQANKWFTKKSDRGSLCISERASSLINISLPCSPQATQRLPSISLKSSCNTAKY